MIGRLTAYALVAHAAVVLGTAPALPAAFKADVPYRRTATELVFPGCEKSPVCRISRSEGGITQIFEIIAAEFLASPRRIIIDGPCKSACVLLADIARSRVCITPRAEFHLHKWMQISPEVKPVEPKMSSDIRAWVTSNGGIPDEGWLQIPPDVQRKFWRPCKGTDT
jgi:hypothetical protein